MVNTLRRKKDKEPAAVPDINGGANDSSPAMTLTQAPPVLQTSVSVEERNKALIPPVKVRFGHFYIWFIAGFYLSSNEICLICILRTLMLLLSKPCAEKTLKQFFCITVSDWSY